MASDHIVQMTSTNSTTTAVMEPPKETSTTNISTTTAVMEPPKDDQLYSQLSVSRRSSFGGIQSLSETPNGSFRAVTTPVLKAVRSMRLYLEEVGQLTKLHPHEAWLPITESRDGNAYYAAFHTLSSGIGIQALVLPLAFTALGWTWGILCLCLAFAWQMYTLWLLIELHEAVQDVRFSRYLQLAMAAFGEKRGKLLALFPTMYLSGGTCVTLIIIGGGTMKIFYDVVCDTSSPSSSCQNLHRLSTLEWYVVFTVAAALLAQLPNLNSIAGVSLVGAVSAVTYCTLIWIVSISKGRTAGVSYGLPDNTSNVARLRKVLNAFGIIAFAFRGHNLVLEIQGTMPSSLKNPSRVSMWKGVKSSYLIIALCLFPLAIGGYWAYGEMIPSQGGMLTALHKYHKHDTSKFILGLASLLVVIHCLMCFQIYAMPVFDNLESKYTISIHKPCPWWLRSGFRFFFAGLAFFVSIALPFLQSLAGLIGGLALPVTMAYPCLMWVMIKKPDRYSLMWVINWVLGGLGIILSIFVVFGAIWTIVTDGIEVHFFKPQ